MDNLIFLFLYIKLTTEYIKNRNNYLIKGCFMKDLKEVLKNKKVGNSFKQVLQTLEAKWFTLEFFDKEGKTWFYIIQKK